MSKKDLLELVIKDRLNRLKMIFNHKKKINENKEEHIFKDNKKEIIEILKNKRLENKYDATLRFRKWIKNRSDNYGR